MTEPKKKCQRVDAEVAVYSEDGVPMMLHAWTQTAKEDYTRDAAANTMRTKEPPTAEELEIRMDKLQRTFDNQTKILRKAKQLFKPLLKTINYKVIAEGCNGDGQPIDVEIVGEDDVLNSEPIEVEIVSEEDALNMSADSDRLEIHIPDEKMDDKEAVSFSDSGVNTSMDSEPMEVAVPEPRPLRVLNKNFGGEGTSRSYSVVNTPAQTQTYNQPQAYSAVSTPIPTQTYSIKCSPAQVRTYSPAPTQTYAMQNCPTPVPAKTYAVVSPPTPVRAHAYQAASPESSRTSTVATTPSPAPSPNRSAASTPAPTDKPKKIKTPPKKRHSETKLEGITDFTNYIVTIGPNKTQVPAKVYEGINWSSPTIATRKLLTAIFDRETLATHTMTGKPSPAFRDMDKPKKKMLNPDIVADIIFTVTRKCETTEKVVRNAITTKCADENKMYKQQLLKDKNKENIRKN